MSRIPPERRMTAEWSYWPRLQLTNPRLQDFGCLGTAEPLTPPTLRRTMSLELGGPDVGIAICPRLLPRRLLFALAYGAATPPCSRVAHAHKIVDLRTFPHCRTWRLPAASFGEVATTQPGRGWLCSAGRWTRGASRGVWWSSGRGK